MQGAMARRKLLKKEVIMGYECPTSGCAGVFFIGKGICGSVTIVFGRNGQEVKAHPEEFRLIYKNHPSLTSITPTCSECGQHAIATGDTLQRLIETVIRPQDDDRKWQCRTPGCSGKSFALEGICERVTMVVDQDGKHPRSTVHGFVHTGNPPLCETCGKPAERKLETEYRPESLSPSGSAYF